MMDHELVSLQWQPSSRRSSWSSSMSPHTSRASTAFTLESTPFDSPRSSSPISWNKPLSTEFNATPRADLTINDNELQPIGMPTGSAFEKRPLSDESLWDLLDFAVKEAWETLSEEDTDEDPISLLFSKQSDELWDYQKAVYSSETDWSEYDEMNTLFEYSKPSPLHSDEASLLILPSNPFRSSSPARNPILGRTFAAVTYKENGKSLNKRESVGITRISSREGIDPTRLPIAVSLLRSLLWRTPSYWRTCSKGASLELGFPIPSSLIYNSLILGEVESHQPIHKGTHDDTSERERFCSLENGSNLRGEIVHIPSKELGVRNIGISFGPKDLPLKDAWIPFSGPASPQPLTYESRKKLQVSPNWPRRHFNNSPGHQLFDSLPSLDDSSQESPTSDSGFQSSSCLSSLSQLSNTSISSSLGSFGSATSSSQESSSPDLSSDDSDPSIDSEKFLFDLFISAKSRIVDKLMKELHTELHSKPQRTCAGGQRTTSTSTPASYMQYTKSMGERGTSGLPLNDRSRKRQDEDDGDQDDDDSERHRKNGSGSPGNHTAYSPPVRLACPFFKHNPRHHKGRACRYPGFKGVHRMKYVCSYLIKYLLTIG